MHPILHSLPASIGSLPAEILLIIFRLCYDSYEEEQTSSLLYDPGDWSEPDICQPEALPFNIAGTCTAWLSLALSVPAFWKSLAIFVGSDPTPLETVRRYLEASGEQPVQVIVARREDAENVDNYVNDPFERNRVAAITDILVPHLHRMHLLDYNVAHPSSLPSICGAIHGHATKLHSLNLRALGPDITQPDRDAYQSLQPPPLKSFSCPRLKWLTLDGRNFRRARGFVSQLMTDTQCLKTFTLMNDCTERLYGEPSFDAYSVMKLLEAGDAEPLDEIELVDVHFDRADAKNLDGGLPKPRALRWVLEDLDAHTMRDVLAVVDWSLSVRPAASSLTIVNCDIPKHCPSLPSFKVLELVNVEISSRLLKRWKGCTLDVRDCPTFDNSTLDLLDTTEDSLCPRLNSLIIRDCPVTWDALMEMVKWRLKRGGHHGLCGLEFLHVSGRGDPPKDMPERFAFWGTDVSWE